MGISFRSVRTFEAKDGSRRCAADSQASFRRAPALARRHRIETKLVTEAARFTDRRFGAPPPRPAMEMLASYRAPFARLAA